jgi:hypothetical protein
LATKIPRASPQIKARAAGPGIIHHRFSRTEKNE